MHISISKNTVSKGIKVCKLLVLDTKEQTPKEHCMRQISTNHISIIYSIDFSSKTIKIPFSCGSFHLILKINIRIIHYFLFFKTVSQKIGMF